MKTEDELDAQIAKLFDLDAEKAPDTKVKKRLISDEETIAQMEREEQARRLEEACGMFLSAERRFQKLTAHPDKVTDPKVNLAWWEALESVYEREKVVQRLFVGPQPTLEQNKLYARFRDMLLKGTKLTSNA
jgi:hypothetical protein